MSYKYFYYTSYIPALEWSLVGLPLLNVTLSFLSPNDYIYAPSIGIPYKRERMRSKNISTSGPRSVNLASCFTIRKFNTSLRSSMLPRYLHTTSRIEKTADNDARVLNPKPIDIIASCERALRLSPIAVSQRGEHRSSQYRNTLKIYPA